MRLKRLIILALLVLASNVELFAQYQFSIKVGSYEYLPLDPPAGWVTTASWSCDSDLKLTDKSEVGAIVTVTNYFEGGKQVNCTYTYTYVGTYDGNYHVGHGTKTYRILCVGGTATISETSLELSPGETHTLKCSRSDSYGTPEWSSSNEDVVTVSSNGKVTAIATGSATIKLNPITAAPCFCNVKVRKIDPTSIDLTPNPLTVVEGKTKTLKPTYAPKGASASLTWISENENIATVSSSGVVKGVSKGSTNIIAKTDNGLSATARVEVIGPPTAVNLPSNVKIAVGYYYTLKPTLTPSNSETTYKWKSSDTSVATVTSAGKIYGKKEGSVVITVTTDNNLTASTNVQIVGAPVGVDTGTANYRIKTINNIIKKLSTAK